jgi:ABC-type phosphate transport system substrate-binding protein
MHRDFQRTSLRWMAALAAIVVLCAAGSAAIKNMAVVASADSKLSDVALADLTKLCKGTAKAWPDGKNFVLVVKNPDSPEMHGVLQKLFGNGDVKVAIAKLNETRQAVRIVDSDDDLLRAVDSTPGAIGIVDVYAINSSVKVLRIDGKLPFDMGYSLKIN